MQTPPISTDWMTMIVKRPPFRPRGAETKVHIRSLWEDLLVTVEWDLTSNAIVDESFVRSLVENDLYQVKGKVIMKVDLRDQESLHQVAIALAVNEIRAVQGQELEKGCGFPMDSVSCPSDESIRVENTQTKLEWKSPQLHVKRGRENQPGEDFEWSHRDECHGVTEGAVKRQRIEPAVVRPMDRNNSWLSPWLPSTLSRASPVPSLSRGWSSWPSPKPPSASFSAESRLLGSMSGLKIIEENEACKASCRNVMDGEEKSHEEGRKAENGTGNEHFKVEDSTDEKAKCITVELEDNEAVAGKGDSQQEVDQVSEDEKEDAEELEEKHEKENMQDSSEGEDTENEVESGKEDEEEKQNEDSEGHGGDEDCEYADDTEDEKECEDDEDEEEEENEDDENNEFDDDDDEKEEEEEGKGDGMDGKDQETAEGTRVGEVQARQARCRRVLQRLPRPRLTFGSKTCMQQTRQ